MKDKEFYSPSAEWSEGNRDEGSTLGKAGATGKPSSFKRMTDDNKQRRRKRNLVQKGNALLASVCVAAVVLTSGAPEVTEVVKQVICGVCGRINCQYWDDHHNCEVYDENPGGVEIYNGEFRPGWNYLGNYSDEGEHYSISSVGLRTKDGSLASLCYNMRNLDYGHGIGYVTQFLFEPITDYTAVQEMEFYINEHSLGEYNEYNSRNAVARLIYSPGGDLADYYKGNYHLGMDYEHASRREFNYTELKPVDLYSGLFLEVGSDVSQEVCKNIMDNIYVQISPPGNNVYYIGETLQLQETGSIKYTGSFQTTSWYMDVLSDGHISMISMVDGTAYELITKSEIMHVNVNSASLSEVCRHLSIMEEDAPKNGHWVLSKMRQLEDYEANGIAYHTYALSRINGVNPEDGSPYIGCELIFAPVHEDNVAFVFGQHWGPDANIEADQFHSWRDFNLPPESFELFNQISMR